MSEIPDLSAIFSMLSNNGENKNTSPEEMFMTLMNSSSNNSNTINNNASSNSNETNQHTSNNTKSSINDNMPDMETIMRLMKMMNATNQDSPSKELLKSLKPFLNDSRKEKIDQYIKILGMTKIFEIFNELGDKSK